MALPVALGLTRAGAAAVGSGIDGAAFDAESDLPASDEDDEEMELAEEP